MTLRGIEALPDAEAWAATTADYIVAHYDGMAADDPVFDVTAAIERVSQVSSSEAVNTIIGEFVPNPRRLGQRRGGGHPQRRTVTQYQGDVLDVLTNSEEKNYRYWRQGQRRLQGGKWVKVTYDQKSTYKVSSSHADDDKYDDVYVTTAPFAGSEATSAYVEHLQAVSPVYGAALTAVSTVTVGGIDASEGTLEAHGAEDVGDVHNTGSGSGANGGEDTTEEASTRTYIIAGAVCAGILLGAALWVPELRRRRKKRGVESSIPQQAIINTMVNIIAPAGRLGVTIDTSPGGGPATVCEVEPASPLLGEIQLGDKIVAVDDEDIQRQTATSVSNLLGSKRRNERRKITVAREMEQVAESKEDNDQIEERGRTTHNEKHEEEEETAAAANPVTSSGILSSTSAPPKLQQEQTPSPSPKCRLDIIVPPGKLGILLVTPEPPAPPGPPFVFNLRANSSLSSPDGLRLGDEIIAVDEEDVQTMSATDVIKLLGSKSGERERKITVLRGSSGETVGKSGNQGEDRGGGGSLSLGEDASSSPLSATTASIAEETPYRQASACSAVTTTQP